LFVYSSRGYHYASFSLKLVHVDFTVYTIFNC